MSTTPTPTTDQVAAVIDGAIKAKGYTVNQTAKLSHVPRQTLERKLAGAGAFDTTELGRLAPVLSTTVSAILAAAEQAAA